MTVLAEQAAKRRYGFPFLGTASAVDRHEVPLNMVGSDSREVLVEPGKVPELGKVKRRHGSASLGSNNGVLEMANSEAAMRGLEVFALRTLVSGDGFPVPAVIFADESKRYGQLWWHDGVTDHTEGEEFGAAHYPFNVARAVAGGIGYINAPPIPVDGNGATCYTRMVTERQRRRTIAGTRKHVGFKNREYFGGFLSAPTNCTRDYSLSTANGANYTRRYPSGLIMPLKPATRVNGDYPAAVNNGPWQMGDQYLEAWAFEFEDGTRSIMMTPRPVQPAGTYLTVGYGLVTVLDTGAAAPTQFYPYVPDRNIRIGPPGTRRRLKYRSDKITKAQALLGAVPNINTMKLAAIIEDNVTTSYNDFFGDNGDLVTDPLMRLDQVWQYRSRYDWSFDQRHAAGYLRPSPYAMVVAPTGHTNAGTINFADDHDDAVGGGRAYLVQLRQDTVGVMTLKLREIVLGGGAPADSALALAGLKLQDVCDWINTNTVASAASEWGAQIVPGAGSQVSAANLAPSHIDVALCQRTINSPNLSTGTANGFADIAEDMEVNDTHYPAGTYVKTKIDSTHLVLSANSDATGAASDCEFYCNTGDEACFTDATAHSQHGNMRAFGNCIPVILAFKQSYLDTFPTEKRSFIVTTADPSQKPNGAMLFHTSPGGKYEAEVAAGILMGGAPLHSGCAAFYSNRSGYYRNIHAGSTGLDSEYRMDWTDFEHGCRSPYSIVHGNGWVGCWRDDGFWIFDGERTAIITKADFDPNNGKGDFAYESSLCNAAAAADSDDYGMFAAYVQGRLWLNFRTEAGTYATKCYDASQSIEASGIAQMLDKDGNPYGWSPICTYNWRSLPEGTGGAIGSVMKADGIEHLYQADNKNDRANCGLVQEFETVGNFFDGTDLVQWQIYTTTDMAGGLKRFAARGRMTLLFRNQNQSGATSLVEATIYRNQQRTGGAVLNLPLTAGDFFTRKVIPVGLKAGYPGEVVEIWLHNATSGSDVDDLFELSGIELPVELLDSLT